MPTRRTFFSAIAFFTAGLWPYSAFGRQRWGRRRVAPPTTPTGNTEPITRGKFPTGYYYRDRDIEFVVPDLTKWSKLEVGMSTDDVRRLLGRPLEGEGTGEPDYVSPQEIEQLVAQGLSVEEAKAAVREHNARCRQAGHIFIEAWIYGWLKLGDGELIWTFFSVAFQDRKVFAYGDAFGGGRNRLNYHVEARFSSDGRPTAPRLLSPYDNAKFTHSPLLLDFRWLPSCGEYPLEYIVELTTSDVEIDEVSRTVKHVWFDSRPMLRQVKSPHLALNAPGGGRYRWRVKAKNRLGESDWSEYREFQFD